MFLVLHTGFGLMITTIIVCAAAAAAATCVRDNNNDGHKVDRECICTVHICSRVNDQVYVKLFQFNT